ncbi:DUF885 domain-containing protein [Prauserella sp. PE36]|uniref:DUF885 domain-containing protein n=1 Tax=Prauserella sp. PE36 TaxID=1504709 RepID=UPI000DE2FADA|nr:DUF885 domain-containing protein [Prauserella sp. PE36]RBM18313.1 DUF885 domain-containing protein [Prauserella sp. PE36]
MALTIRSLADRVWDHVLRTEPHYALRNGQPVERLPCGSHEEAEERVAVGRSVREALIGIDVAALEQDERNTAALLRFVADDWTRADESWWWHFPVAPYQMFEFSHTAPQVFDVITFADSTADVERFHALAADLARRVRVAEAKLRAQAERGWGIPRAALPGFVSTVEGMRVAMRRWLTLDDSRLEPLSPALRGRLQDGLRRVEENDILPAVDSLLRYLDGTGRDTAAGGVGLGQYPGGERAYRELVRQYASFDISPEEVHELGLAQVAELTEQMAKLRAEVGFDGDEAAYRRVLEADERFHARGADDVAATYRRHIAAIEPLVGGWFSVLPEAGYEVERLDPELEAGLSYGYYEQPGPTNPAGRYRYNGSGLDTRSQIDAATLIYHELVPGHHFHLARQEEDASLHPVRGVFAPELLGAYTEGWAEYAASLGTEMGLYTDPWDRYGHYVHQRFTAQRLVVDTGLNALGWSLEEAARYMASTTMESPGQIRTETLRYSTDMPGQALGYRLGFLKFWELRSRAAEALGPAFDVRDFHEIVLGAGALPLTAVAENVASFVAERTT